jgi:hypothetical protein
VIICADKLLLRTIKKQYKTSRAESEQQAKLMRYMKEGVSFELLSTVHAAQASLTTFGFASGVS